MHTAALRIRLRAIGYGGVGAAALLVIAIIIWQAIAMHGAPDPTQSTTSPTAAFLGIGVLVFREGLECILVLIAITASMTGSNQPYWRSVAVGAGLGARDNELVFP